MDNLTPQQMAQLQQLMRMQREETSKPLVEFRAGLCVATGKSVRPDARRGKVSILKEDDAVKFQWSLRPSNSVEISLILLPRQAVWERVKECRDGRVYLLKFRDGSVKHYFWLQEPKETEEKDDTLAKQVNDAIVSGASSSSSSSSSAGASSSLTDLNAMQIDPTLLAEMGGDAAEQAALLSMIQQAAEENRRNAQTTAPTTPARPTAPAVASSSATTSSSASASSTSTTASTTASSTAPSGAGAAGQQSALLSAISQLAAQFAAQQAQGETIEKQPRLNDIIDVEKVCTMVLEDEKLFESLSALLPEGQRSKEDFKAHLRSPQFQSTLSRMSGILSTAQYGQLLASLALPTNTDNIGVLGFLEAIQKSSSKDSSSSSGSKK